MMGVQMESEIYKCFLPVPGGYWQKLLQKPHLKHQQHYNTGYLFASNNRTK